MTPSPHAFFAIALAVLMIVLCTREKLPLEATSLLIFILVLVWFEIFPIELDGVRVRARDFFAGFGNEALISVVTLMILTRGLELTGALQPIGHVLSNLWKRRPRLAFLATLVTAAFLSMFLNNTPVVAAVLPLLVAVSLRARVPPSGILMPVGFATIIGGMATTIGTSTNLLVTSIAAQSGMPEFGMFDFALPAVIVGGVAILYLWLIAPRLLPARSPPLTDVSPRIFESSLLVNEDSVAQGKTLTEVIALTDGRMRVGRIARGELALVKLPSVMLRAGDRLHVTDTAEHLKEYERLLGATLLASEAERVVSPDRPRDADQYLAEVVVTRGSVLDQRTLDSTSYLSAYGVAAVALRQPHRGARAAPSVVGDVLLQAGDVLLVQGSKRALERLKRRGQVLVLDGRVDLPRTAKAPAALAIMVAVVLLAAFGVMRISVAAVSGLALMLVTQCISVRDAFGAIDRRIVMVIVASLALGLALVATGAVDYIAALYVAAAAGLPTAVALSGFLLIIALLTEVVTNNAVGVLGTPIAISVAQQLGVPAEPFVLAVLYGANMSYMTPLGYQTNLLVMSAGGYRFSDFLRAGIPLQLIMWIGLSIVLPIIYGL